MFDPAIANVALGHLHLAQRVVLSEVRRYSGSPLPL
jgi:exonuclease SbcD